MTIVRSAFMLPINLLLMNLSEETFNSEQNTKYILFNGTTVLQTRTLPDQPVSDLDLVLYLAYQIFRPLH